MSSKGLCLESLSYDEPCLDPANCQGSIVESKERIEQLLEKSILYQPGFGSHKRDPESVVSKRLAVKQRKKDKLKTKGADWFNMRRPKVTPEIVNDLRLVHMRSALNPKQFYKKNDIKGLPKYFQMGRYVDSPGELYSRIPKKQRKKTMVEELMQDAHFLSYNKKRHRELIAHVNRHTLKTHARAHRHAKQLKKRKNNKTN